jgi:kinesin family protein 12
MLADLAGSEMTKKTQSEGKTLEEANNINKR